MKTWAGTCASQQWKFACYIMSLPQERWVRRMLYWQPFGRGLVGRPAMNWTSKLELLKQKQWGDWKDVATDADHWMMEMDVREILYKVADFVSQLVHNFEDFLLVRAANRAAFSACEPQTFFPNSVRFGACSLTKRFKAKKAK